MTIDQLCELTDLTRIKVSYALRHGKLKAKKIGKLVYNIEPVDVLEWLIPAETFEILEKVYPGRDELKKDLLAVFKQWSE